MPRPKKNKQAGAAFKELLKEKGFSNSKLAKAIGMGAGHIGSYEWWQSKSKEWIESLFSVINYRNLGYALNYPIFGVWDEERRLIKQFSEQQEELLKQYHEANRLLVDCLNNASDTVRSHIEDTLLLPIAEIEKRRLGD